MRKADIRVIKRVSKPRNGEVVQEGSTTTEVVNNITQGSSVDVVGVGNSNTLTNDNVLSSLRTIKEITDRAVKVLTTKEGASETNVLSALFVISLIADCLSNSKTYTDGELKKLDKKYVSKLNDDTIQGLITFTKGLKGGNWSINDSIAKLAKLLAESITTNELSSDTIKSKGFKPNSEGFVLKTDENGKSYLEVDTALIRRKATFVELVIASLRHVGGQITLSPASMRCIKVEERDNAYRCYFRNTDGEKCVYNEFVVGDLARAQKFGSAKVGVSKNISTHYFWRAVVGVGDDYIDLSKTDCDKGSDAPQVGDDICQFGNKTDTDRQSVILLSAYGEYAGIYQFGGVNDYSLKGKEQTAISPSGNRFTGDFIVKGKNVTEIIDKSKTDAINQSNGYVNGVKTELDGKIGEVKGKIDGLKVGGRNLLLNSNVHNSSDNYSMWGGKLSEDWINGQTYIATIKMKKDIGEKPMVAFANDGYGVPFYFKKISDKLYRAVYTHNDTEGHIPSENRVFTLYDKNTSWDNNAKQQYQIDWVKLEKGTIATDWTPAPEDLELEIEQAKNEAISQAQNKFNQAVEQAKDLSTSAKADAIAEAQRGYLAAIDKSKQETTSAIDSVRDAVLLDAKDKYDKAVAEAKKLSDAAKDQAMADAKAKYEKAVKEANAYADRAKQQAIEEAKANTEREIKIVNNKFEATKEAFTSQYNEVKANLKDVSVKQTQIRQDVDKISLRADRAEEKVSGLDKRLSQAELKITPDAITSVVKSNMKIGGRNLARDSERRVIDNLGKTHDYQYVILCNLEAGTYTLSAELEDCANTHEASAILYSHDGKSIWREHRFNDTERDAWTFTFTKEQSGSQIVSILLYAGIAGKTRDKKVVWKNIKLEKGNIATDWSPAPEETKASIAELSTRIEQTDESITAKVLQGEQNVKQEVLSSFSMDSAGISLLGKKLNFVGLATFSAINQAKAEAISDAQKKADAARDAAISEAQNKVDAAKKELGTQITEAQTKALNDAQTKFNNAIKQAEQLSGQAKDDAIIAARNELNREIKAANGYADKVIKALAAKLGSLAYSDKVGKAVLDETIIAGGFIKTSLIKADELIVNKVASVAGTFEKLESGKENDGCYMQLTRENILFDVMDQYGTNVVKFGNNAVNSMEVASYQYIDSIDQTPHYKTICPLSIVVEPKGGLVEHVGIGINMTEKGKTAIKVGNGIYKGFRRPVVVTTVGMDASPFDTHIYTITRSTITLPNAEVGQEYYIWVPSFTNPTIKLMPLSDTIKTEGGYLYYAVKKTDNDWLVAKVGSIIKD